MELTQEGPADSRLFFKADLIGDGVEERGDADLRELYLDLSPAQVLDIRAGRQILTWGTGDLIFINDLFPKDFVSFFIGRSLEYLKLGSDAVKFSLYPGPFSLDIVAVPHFTPSEIPKGERLSFFNPFANRIAASGESLSTRKPAATAENTELAFRLFRTFGSYEGAFYGFRGFFKEPAGIDPESRVAFHPKLSVYGASLRGPLLQGVASLEFGYYDSREDRTGRNPFVENSSLRYLLGYERELWTDLTVRVQYFLEQALDYGAYKATLSLGAPEKKEYRHLLFLRLTRLLRYQTVELSFIGFYGPSDRDGMAIPQVSYKITDRWSVSAGANIFFGTEGFTQFGQLDRDDNLYLRLRTTF
ncbi:MAG: hypothetical protein HZA60_08900 [Deltaproteobacteria bacterium]|nr:hypothetical protein [Deltaproteobacteria bacterium]